jgi:YidC/Oxa1 family membrane protein insertase
MEQARLIIALALSFLVILVWQFFFVDREAVQSPEKTAAQKPATQEQSAQPAQPSKAAAPEVSAAPATGGDEPAVTTAHPARTLVVDTPLYQVAISEKGAAFTGFLLKQYREAVSKNSPLKQLLPQEPALSTLLVGFAGNSVGGLDTAVFSAKSTEDRLTVGDSPKQLVFAFTGDTGVTIEKTFRFSPDSYVIAMDVTVINRSERPLQDSLVVNLNGASPSKDRVYGFVGPSVMIGDKVEEIKIKDLDEKDTFSGPIRWVSLQDRYFMSSLMPQEVQEASVRVALTSDDMIQSRYVEPQQVIGAGTQFTSSYELFLGPKSTEVLDTVGHGLRKAVSFGMFDILARPCLWIMNKLYSVIPNYGVAIIILTVLIKLLLWPLGNKSYKSMSEMKKIQPLMQQIREKYKNDKKRMNEEVMALYRAYKINPLGGCLPMVVQIPVFFALYRMLYQAIELRHAPFFGWIDDLSAPDRLFRFDVSIPLMEPPYGIPVLTLIMGATMLLQQKMSPPMGDPAQAKMMMLMPVVFTFIFINFSSGLVLYWLVNNVLSIGQQYYIQKKFA